MTVSFWKSALFNAGGDTRPHFIRGFRHAVATEAPIDFKCKKDLEWVGAEHKAGSEFRLIMAAFYCVSANDKFEYVRVYPVYHPDYQLS